MCVAKVGCLSLSIRTQGFQGTALKVSSVSEQKGRGVVTGDA